MKLYELSAAQLARDIADGRVSAVEATQSALERIGAVEPKVDALLHLDADGALARAAAVQAEIDRRRRAGAA